MGEGEGREAGRLRLPIVWGAVLFDILKPHLTPKGLVLTLRITVKGIRSSLKYLIKKVALPVAHDLSGGASGLHTRSLRLPNTL